QNAASPGKIVSYMQEIIDDNSKNKADEDQTAFDVLIGTLKKVVKDKLAEGGNDFYKLENDYQNQLSEEDFEKVLKKRGTIDLRVMEN
ncbi:hypothetical protein KAZ01_02295, partial [Candidatus Gracilibacteria bacterium]|nr:hypothetical protein [Candidatus Gracilibacteria bacterium]